MNCDVIQDLLPLYCDGVCSEESSTLVEAHLHTCVECRKTLRLMQTPEVPASQTAELDAAASAGKVWKRGTRRAFRRGLALALGLLLVVGLGILGSFLGKHYQGSCADGDQEALRDTIVQDIGKPLGDIELSARKGSYLAVACRDEAGMWTVGVFQPDTVFSQRWVYKGGLVGVRPGHLANWNWNVEDTGTVLVCFGADLPDYVTGYSFTNSGVQYTCPVTDNYVFDFFFVPDTYDEHTWLMPIKSTNDKER